MKTSNNGLKIIKNFEGLRLSAYRDVAGVWTIGYGSTRYYGGKAIKPGDKLANEQQAATLLRNTLGQYEDAVNNYVKVLLTQNQFDALISFTYNLGTHALAESHLLKALNEKDYAGVASQFLLWDKITDAVTGEKIICDTLQHRRKTESELFQSSENYS